MTTRGTKLYRLSLPKSSTTPFASTKGKATTQKLTSQIRFYGLIVLYMDYASRCSTARTFETHQIPETESMACTPS